MKNAYAEVSKNEKLLKLSAALMQLVVFLTCCSHHEESKARSVFDQVIPD